MKKSSRISMMMAMILLVLIFSAMLTVPAYADDSTPPPTETPTEVAPPVDGYTESLEPIEPAPVVEEAAVADTAADILAQIPEGTDVVVVNTDGEVLPLATEEAAHALVNGDPLWCPVGVAPSSTNPLCSGSFAGFGNTGGSELVSWLDSHDPAKAGVIWIEYNYNGWNNEPNYSITLDGAEFANLDNFALTIQGGWNGVNGNRALNVSQPYSTFQIPLTITGWTGAITLKNINVTLNAAYSSGATVNALTIITKGNITLDTVNVVNNKNGAGVSNGARLDNTSSSAGATVTIKNSSFDQNAGYGLQVYSDGIITIANISANENGGVGASINNTSASPDKAVTITGFQQFNNNLDYGLYIISDGAVTLANLVADGNAFGGVVVDNRTSTGNLGVTIKGVNQFNNNISGNGLVVQSHGVITLNSVSANKNSFAGIYLDNYTGATLPKAVILTGTNIFNGNAFQGTRSGLIVYSLGAITISNVTASNNNVQINDGGVYLNNSYAGAVGGVTINGYGTFEHNAAYGLQIFSKGAILLNNINSNENGFGALIDNCGPDFSSGAYPTCANVKPLTLKGTNNFNGNIYYGLEALSGGAILASNLTANGNGGAESFYNSINTNAPAIGNAFLVGRLSISLTGVNTFNDNVANSTDPGVRAISSGKIAISNLNANGNTGTGANLTGGNGVALILTGINTFNNNGNYGLLAPGNYGTVTLSNVTANGNGDGVFIKNDYVNTTPWNVTLLGTNQFNENAYDGLMIVTYGTVLLNNITANYNHSGLIVNNSIGLPTLPKPITLTGYNNFNNNDGEDGVGLVLRSIGVITLNNITANKNSRGTYIQNNFGIASAASPGVFIKGNNSFSYNGNKGLEIYTNGAITLNNIDASYNGDFGAYLVNSSGLLKTVTISGVNNFNGNKYSGLYIAASGVVTLSRITANNNDPTNLYGTAGINVTTVKNIYLTCGYTFNNGSYGTYLNSTGGTVTVKGLYSFWNVINVAILSFLPSLAINYPCALP